MNKHIWKNIGAENRFYINYCYRVNGNFNSGVFIFSLCPCFPEAETYQFPQRLLPKLSFDVRVEYIRDKYKIDLYHDDIDGL